MIPILIATLIVVNAVVLTRFSDTSQKLAEQQSMTVKTRNSLQTAQERVSELSEQKTSINSSLKKERLKTQKLQKENKQLKAKKQARLAAQKAEQQQTTVSHKQPKAVAVSGSCDSWLAQAGITDLHNAKALIARESGCNPNAVNPSSGACGVGQELPCGKSGCSLGDGACQVAWMKKYVEGRYGSFAAAMAHSNAQGWY